MGPLLQPDDIIWVHDYHLIPLARELRRMGCRNRIGFFLHIPWPAPQLLTTLPRHADLVSSLFDYDLVGFQTADWLAAFHGYVLDEAGGEVLEDGVVRAFGRSIRAAAFPIGIDAQNFAEIVRSPEAERSYDRAAATGVFRDMIVGVDRIDYSKGLEERFLAVEELLESHPELVERVFLLQIAQTSRATWRPTRTYAPSWMRSPAASTAPTPRWTGARSATSTGPTAGMRSRALYRAAKVGLVTPLRDGMNLVGKEYVAAQNPDDPGVLVLSRFAGAALQMGEALIVNPYSREDVADAIARGLNMPKAERIRRWESLFHGVQTQDAAWWRDAFVAALHSLPETSVDG